MTMSNAAANHLIGNLGQLERVTPAEGGIGEHALKIVPPGSATNVPTGALQRRRALVMPGAASSVVILALIFAIGWYARRNAWLSPASGLGYSLGIIGASMMLILLLYPIRKHVRFMHAWGPLKYWFKFHMVSGVLGPLLVLLHSNFRVGSLNAGVALLSMLLVVASGLVGRFIYRKIHHGLYGSQASLKELKQVLDLQVESVDQLLRSMPAVRLEVDAFVALASHESAGWWRRLGLFLTIGWKRRKVDLHLQHALAANAGGGHMLSPHPSVTNLIRHVSATLRAAQRYAQFSMYERLFSLWHVVHIPFLCMLVLTALVHVVAVHAY